MTLAAAQSTPRRVVERRGFTLLELMVVLAVVAILASLLSAALNRTKSKAQQISCLNRLRQLQISWFFYVDDHEDRLPLNRTVPSALDERIFGRANSSNSWVAGNPKVDLDTRNIEQGTLFPYSRSTSVYHCPADRSTVIDHPEVRRTRSYSMSAYLNGDGAGIDPRVKTRFAELSYSPPDRVFVFIEEHESSLWAGGFAVAPKQDFLLASSNWLSIPSDRHGQGCNLSFADGHVEYWRWSWPKKAAAVAKGGIGGLEVKDIRKLQGAVPRHIEERRMEGGLQEVNR